MKRKEVKKLRDIVAHAVEITEVQNELIKASDIKEQLKEKLMVSNLIIGISLCTCGMDLNNILETGVKPPKKKTIDVKDISGKVEHFDVNGRRIG